LEAQISEDILMSYKRERDVVSGHRLRYLSTKNN